MDYCKQYGSFADYLGGLLPLAKKALAAEEAVLDKLNSFTLSKPGLCENLILNCSGNGVTGLLPSQVWEDLGSAYQEFFGVMAGIADELGDVSDIGLFPGCFFSTIGNENCSDSVQESMVNGGVRLKVFKVFYGQDSDEMEGVFDFFGTSSGSQFCALHNRVVLGLGLSFEGLNESWKRAHPGISLDWVITGAKELCSGCMSRASFCKS